jgi:hypothetical protein
MTDLYIYYRVREEHSAQLAPRVRVMQAALATAHGVAGSVKRRPEANNGVQTWMEIYPATAAGFEAALALAVDDAALAELIEGPRHTEVFMDLQICA